MCSKPCSTVRRCWNNMYKDFDKWNKRKKIIHEYVNETTHEFNQNEVWWCALGLNIGDEEDGKNELYERPVLIVRKFNKRFMWASSYYFNIIRWSEFKLIIKKIKQLFPY